MINLNINGKAYQVDVAPDVPLVWVTRERLKLIGTKFGCGIGMCGSCTIHHNPYRRQGRALVPDAGRKRTGQKDRHH